MTDQDDDVFVDSGKVENSDAQLSGDVLRQSSIDDGSEKVISR